MARDSRPLLVFFGAAHSGPRLRVAQVDVDEQPQVAERFRVTTVPTLALVKDKRVVGRLEGRVSAPRIERMLAPHLPDELAAA